MSSLISFRLIAFHNAGKFKIGVTVPGDNSIDMYTNDIGLVAIVDSNGELEGFNVAVGG